MKLQKTTWILVALALAVGGFVYFSEIAGQSSRETTLAQQPIFAFAESDIRSLTIEKSGQTLRFERTGDQLQPWQMKQPEDVAASDAAVSFLLNLLVERTNERSLTISPEQKSDYGLDKPLARIKIDLENAGIQELVLGKPSFDGKFVYAQVNPSNEQTQNSILLIPISFQFAVERELSEWQQQTSEFEEAK